MPKSIPLRAGLHSLGVVLYVTLVASVMRYGNQWFGKTDTFLTGVAVLLLLSVSAAVVGSLVFGTPAVWFLAGKRIEGIRLVAWTVGWLALETVLVLILQAIRAR